MSYFFAFSFVFCEKVILGNVHNSCVLEIWINICFWATELDIDLSYSITIPCTTTPVNVESTGCDEYHNSRL